MNTKNNVYIVCNNMYINNADIYFAIITSKTER